MMMKIMMKVYSIFKGYLCVKIRKLGTCDCYNIADLCPMNLLIVEFEDGGIDDGNPAAEMDVEWPINLPIAIDELYNLIVCKGCGVAIPFDRIIAHLQENHGTKTDVAEVMMFLNMMGPSMATPEAEDWIKSTWVGRAVQNIPVKKGVNIPYTR